MGRAILLFFLLATGLSSRSQALMNLDSLLKRLPASKEDSGRVLLLINIGQQYENNQPDKAADYYRQALALSRKSSYPLGEIKSVANLTYVLNMKGLYDSALTLNRYSVQLSRKIKDSVYLAKTLFNTGTSYRQLGDYESAVKCFEEGKGIFIRFGDDYTQAKGDDVLQLLYVQLHQYDKAVAYGEASVGLFRKIGDENGLGVALNNLGLSYTELKRFDKALPVYQETLEIARKTNDKNMENSQYLNLADIALQQGRYEELKSYYEKAQLLARELDLHESQAISLKGLSYYYQYMKNYRLASDYAAKALKICMDYRLLLELSSVYTHLSNLSYSMQDMRAGESYASLSRSLNDSILNEAVRKNTLELEKKYESERKTAEINQLQAERSLQQYVISRKNGLNLMLAAGSLMLLIIFILVYRNYRQKQKLQQRRIEELETEKKLGATEAVLKGEEIERTRLARDLHDGLGGMLSGIRYSLNNMKGNLVMTADNAQHFDRSIDMLDSSIQEMRRVAHNMMPEALVKFGLDTALRDFCHDINQSGALQVTYQGIGMENGVSDQTTAITIYRIVQELIHNTMKHAGAGHAIVQVAKTAHQLSVTVEDDGKGFDAAATRPGAGIGWRNIRNRVEFLKGRLDLNSAPGKGTSVFIEFQVA